ncbi:MFS transporter [Arthrobacter sp. zg-Y877]|uniref:MFS transporter n=1 Tax=Arthrobacter sp. zg-Y877 TaxID=3049074 RepID=UPI0025A3E7F6|nr:MFS transporter [Arthrobacter sp. zg-Y877]MDM7989198.1 MFS transporter [Arthrobacter sp. zg-Y877]
MVVSPAERGSTRRFPDWLMVATLGCGGIVVSLEKTSVVPLLPEYPRIFGVTTDDVSWLVTVTLLSAAVATPIISRLADMYGKRRMLLVAMVLMVAGAFTASIGGTFTWALVGRGLQGSAGAVIPVGISILRDALPQQKIAGAVALMSASFGIGSALGLPLAGLVYERLGWQATFWVVGVVGIVLIAAVVVFVPESNVRAPARFDYAGAVLLSAGMTAVLLAITKGGVWGWTSYPVLGLFAAAAVAFALWFPAELRNGQPLVDLRTSARRPVLLTNIGAVLVGFSMYANMLVTTQQLQLSGETGYGFGLSVLTAGLTMIPSGLAMVAAAPVSARITNMFGARVTLATGCAVMAAGYLARFLFVGSVTEVIVGAVIVSTGTAISMAAMPTIIMSNVPLTDTAAANGLNTLLRSVGTSTCSAVVATILASLTVTVSGTTFPGLDAFRTIFVLAGFAALAATGVACLIPPSRRHEATHPNAVPGGRQLQRAEEKREIMVSGRLIAATDGRPVDRGTVTVVDSDGRPVDWGRADDDGRYAVLLPGDGRYVMVASHVRWQPVSEAVTFPRASVTHDIHFRRPLLLTGRVRHAGRAVANALVILVRPGGATSASARSDSGGNYELALPGPGIYILSVLEPDGQTTHSRRVVLPAPDAVVDVDLGGREPRTGLRI